MFIFLWKTKQAERDECEHYMLSSEQTPNNRDNKKGRNLKHSNRSAVDLSLLYSLRSYMEMVKVMSDALNVEKYE